MYFKFIFIVFTLLALNSAFSKVDDRCYKENNFCKDLATTANKFEEADSPISPCDDLAGGLCLNKDGKYYDDLKAAREAEVQEGYKQVLNSIHSNSYQEAYKKVLEANGIKFKAGTKVEDISKLLEPAFLSDSSNIFAALFAGLFGGGKDEKDYIENKPNCTIPNASFTIDQNLTTIQEEINNTYLNFLPLTYSIDPIDPGNSSETERAFTTSKAYHNMFATADEYLRNDKKPQDDPKLKESIYKYYDYSVGQINEKIDKENKAYNLEVPTFKKNYAACRVHEALAKANGKPLKDGICFASPSADESIQGLSIYTAEGYKTLYTSMQTNADNNIPNLIKTMPKEKLLAAFKDMSTSNLQLNDRPAFEAELNAANSATSDTDRQAKYTALYNKFISTNILTPIYEKNLTTDDKKKNLYNSYCALLNKYFDTKLTYLKTNFYQSINTSKPFVEHINSLYFSPAQKKTYLDVYAQAKNEVRAVYKEKLEPKIDNQARKAKIDKYLDNLNLFVPKDASEMPFKKDPTLPYETLDYDQLDPFEEDPYYSGFQDPSLRSITEFNAYHSPFLSYGVKEQKQYVYLIPGLAKSFDDEPMSLLETAAHEIGHTFGPMISEMVGHPLEKIYPNFIECFKDPLSIGMKKDQADEAVADWFSAEVIGRLAVQAPNPLAFLKEGMNMFCTFYRSFKSLRKEAVEESHPVDIRRINGIFLANPNIRKALGCEGPCNRRYCNP